MDQATDGCVTPAQGPILQESVEAAVSESISERKPVMPLARVGHEAPDFEIAAYLDGGFQNIKLSNYRGQWVVLCFYPGDFTFV